VEEWGLEEREEGMEGERKGGGRGEGGEGESLPDKLRPNCNLRFPRDMGDLKLD